MAFLVVGVAVPTPGGVGGFHEAFRIGVTTFFGADNDAAVGRPSCCTRCRSCPGSLLGLWFAAQDGVSLAGCGDLAGDRARRGDRREP
jgi:hypothetical protein